ncbi:DUF5958 family protein [Mucilaginibacter sp. 22184]|uniref:DUF5958 family protein n=1 Tax=Mucilaginibacter sp. 22184 TaxID=3453887 RepID=UPI003F87B1C9
MNIEEEISINQYGQGLLDKNVIITKWKGNMNLRNYLHGLSNLILQSKPVEADIELAISDSGLKPTFTPCVLLKNGLSRSSLDKIRSLPDNELEKVLILFISLFKSAYIRRFNAEKENPNKWWYWDLSNEQNIKAIKQKIQ